MNKQTAVEWYAEQDTELTLLYLQGKIKKAELGIKKMDLFNKALAMEKEQIVDAYQKGYLDLIYKPKAYYNKTY